MSFVTTKIPNYYLKLVDLPHHKLNDIELPLSELKATLYSCEWETFLGVNTLLEDFGRATFKRNFKVNVETQSFIKSKATKSPKIFINTASVYKSVSDFKRNFKVNVEASLQTSKTFKASDFKIYVNACLQNPKDFTKNLTVNINASAIRNANAGQIIGDIRFYDKVLNETNYDSTITPYGYGKWRELVTGDYIYEKALCKYSMQASLNADRPNTREYRHKVDVPDVVDRGVATLTKENQPLFVHFSPEDVRKFHIVPELTVSIKSYSGTGTTPLVIPYGTTIDGFYVTMKADGDFVEGSISWSARGY